MDPCSVFYNYKYLTMSLPDKLSGDFADLDVLIAQSMSLIMDESGSRVWNCDFCNRTNRDKANTRIHVETHFPGFEHQCLQCDKQAPSREALRKHIARNHKTN